MLSVGVGGLGSVSFRLPFFGVSFGIVGWVGGFVAGEN